MSLIPKRLFYIVILSLLSIPSVAAWELNNAESNLHFVTSKAAAISEVNSFINLSGDISDDGEARLEIDLASVETAIEIRNQRLRDMLFETEQFPAATITINIDTAILANLAVGSSESASYNYNLDLHGINRDMSADLRLTKVSPTRIEIQPAQPIILGAGLFGLAEGVEALREVAGLPSINPNVVVDFSLVYDDGM